MSRYVDGINIEHDDLEHSVAIVITEDDEDYRIGLDTVDELDDLIDKLILLRNRYYPWPEYVQKGRTHDQN